MSNEQESNSERVVISAKVSPEAAKGWRDFCRINGISKSALLEVAGRQLGAETFPPTVPQRVTMVEEARAIDNARRARTPFDD